MVNMRSSKHSEEGEAEQMEEQREEQMEEGEEIEQHQIEDHFEGSEHKKSSIAKSKSRGAYRSSRNHVTS